MRMGLKAPPYGRTWQGRPSVGSLLARLAVMQSKASIKGHPLHPMLIVYPFAFLTGAFGFSVVAAASRNRDLRTVADHLVPTGIAAGLLAAGPGIIDYLNSVPPDSSAK